MDSEKNLKKVLVHRHPANILLGTNKNIPSDNALGMFLFVPSMFFIGGNNLFQHLKGEFTNSPAVIAFAIMGKKRYAKQITNVKSACKLPAVKVFAG